MDSPGRGSPLFSGPAAWSWRDLPQAAKAKETRSGDTKALRCKARVSGFLWQSGPRADPHGAQILVFAPTRLNPSLHLLLSTFGGGQGWPGDFIVRH